MKRLTIVIPDKTWDLLCRLTDDSKRDHLFIPDPTLLTPERMATEVLIEHLAGVFGMEDSGEEDSGYIEDV